MKKYGKDLSIISHKIKRQIDKKTACLGITVCQSHVLHFIWHLSQTRDVYQKDVESEFELRGSSATSILQNLEKSGYIERQTSPLDHRLKRIILTQKALDTHAEIGKIIARVEEETFSVLSKEEEKVFADILRKIFDKIENY